MKTNVPAALDSMSKKIDEVMRRSIFCGYQVDRVFAGRSNGHTCELKTRNWLLENLEGDSFSIIRNELANTEQSLGKLLHLTAQSLEANAALFDATLNSIETFYNIGELVEITKDSLMDYENLTARKIKQKKVSDFGLSCLKLSRDLLIAFERNTFSQLSKSECLNAIDNSLLEKHLANLNNVCSFGYFLIFSGFRLAIFEKKNNMKPPKTWCSLCFRRNKAGASCCTIHESDNSHRRKSRLAEKIRGALDEVFPQYKHDWFNLKKHILELEAEERQECNVDIAPELLWKTTLIKFINKNTFLNNHLSVVEIQKFSEWISVVDYLRKCFENDDEKSYNFEAVWSWLQMARDWYQFEYLYLTPDGKQLKKSRSPTSSLPTAKLVEALCIEFSGITKTEIANKLKISKAAVSKCVESHKFLQVYF
jgi:hypothetical protein